MADSTIKRRYHLELKLGADTIKDLLKSLESIQFDILRADEEGRIDSTTYNCVSGGHSSGYSFKLEFDREMTHDKYVGEIQEFLLKSKKVDAPTDL